MKKIIMAVALVIVLGIAMVGSWYAGTQYVVQHNRNEYLEMEDGDEHHIYLGAAPESYWILTREKIGS